LRGKIALDRPGERRLARALRAADANDQRAGTPAGSPADVIGDDRGG